MTSGTIGGDVALGSDEEFARILLSYGGKLMAIARKTLGDLHLAEDAVAETYLKAWRKRFTLRDGRKLGGWLTTICRREATSLLRKVARARKREGKLEGEPPAAPSGWDERAYRAELLGRLPDALKTCATMFFVEGHSYVEIATGTGLPLSTVRGRISMSRDRLRKEITMSAETTFPEWYDRFEKTRPQHGRVEWHGCRARLLGVSWSGAKALYNAGGKRLSRLPAALGKSPLWQKKKSFGRWYDGPTLSFYWQLTGNLECSLGANAYGARTGASCTPSSASIAGTPQKVVEMFCAPPPESETHVRIFGTMAELNRDASGAFRWDTGLQGLIATSQPGWGAVCLFAPLPGPRKGTSLLHVAFSSPLGEAGCSLFALDESGAEAAPAGIDAGGSDNPEGHLRGMVCEFEVPPDKLTGVVLYPWERVSVDWGKVKVPPRPKKTAS